MEYSLLLQLEVLIFIISLWYILYYLAQKWISKNKISFEGFSFGKKIRTSKLSSTPTKNKAKKTTKKTDTKKKKSVWGVSKLTEKQKLRLIEILKRVQTNSAKWYFDTAKNLIVEWLAIDDGNKELNLELANIYEKEKNYKNAQYIYEDLIEKLEDNYEVIKKLAFSLALQWKYKKSVKHYTKAFERKSGDMEVVDALANLLYELWDFKECLKYAKLYLIQKPRNIDKLTLKWVCLEELDKQKEAIRTYQKILEVQPYNSEIINKIKELDD